MADATYDPIVVGGGHQESIIACRIITPYDVLLRHVNMDGESISYGNIILSQLERRRNEHRQVTILV